MPVRVRLQIAAAVTIAILIGIAAGGFYAHGLREAALDAALVPTFREPPPGPRAPTAQAFGAHVGSSSLDDLRAQLARLGLDCPDTGMRALLRQARAAKAKELEDRRRQGLAVDTVSGASAVNRPSRMERSPQVRLRCEEVRGSIFADRPRSSATGRLLFVFDSAELPLRHVSFQQTFADTDTALAELDAAVAALASRYGAPAKRPAVAGLPWLAPVVYEWPFADLVVKVTALNFGQRGVSVTEVIEVPLPVRPDAPALPVLAQAR
jgi:hypothetical protein